MDRLFLKRSPIVFGFFCQKTHSNRGSLYIADTPCWCWWCSVLHEGLVPYPRTWHVCDLKHSRARHDSFICVTWLIHMCQMICLHVSLESHLYACDAKHSRLWHGSLKCVTWLFQMSFICVAWILLTCHMTYSDVRRDPCRCVTYLAKQSNPFPHFRCAHFETWLIYMCACALQDSCVYICALTVQNMSQMHHLQADEDLQDGSFLRSLSAN